MLIAFMAFLVAAAIALIDLKKMAHAQSEDYQKSVSLKLKVKAKRALNLQCVVVCAFETVRESSFRKTKGATPPR